MRGRAGACRGVGARPRTHRISRSQGPARTHFRFGGSEGDVLRTSPPGAPAGARRPDRMPHPPARVSDLKDGTLFEACTVGAAPACSGPGDSHVRRGRHAAAVSRASAASAHRQLGQLRRPQGCVSWRGTALRQKRHAGEGFLREPFHLPLLPRGGILRDDGRAIVWMLPTYGGAVCRLPTITRRGNPSPLS